MAALPFYWVNGQKVKLTLCLKVLPKGTNLEVIGLIYSSNVCHDHGNFMAHSQEFFFSKMLLEMYYLGLFGIPCLHFNLGNFLIRQT